MELFEDDIIELSELKFDDFDNKVDEILKEKSDEEKLAILLVIKQTLKDVKNDLSVIRRFTTDEECRNSDN